MLFYKKQFTMIEFMIVIFVATILIGGIAFAAKGVLEDAKSAAMTSEARNVQTAVTQYFYENGDLPISENSSSVPIRNQELQQAIITYLEKEGVDHPHTVFSRLNSGGHFRSIDYSLLTSYIRVKNDIHNNYFVVEEANIPGYNSELLLAVISTYTLKDNEGNLIAGTLKLREEDVQQNEPIQAVLHPFGTSNVYHSGVIKPNHVSQDEMNKEVKDFYDTWKLRYLRSYGNDMYYVWVNPTGGVTPANTITYSEGMGYGMLATVHMAGYDPNAKRYFDGMYKLSRAVISGTNRNLMAWKIGIDEHGDLYRVDKNAATDGDLDIAYSLLLADLQWGSDGSINYKEEALKIIKDIKEILIYPATSHLKLGDWLTDKTGSRTSDWNIHYFKKFYEVTGDAKWQEVMNVAIDSIGRVQHSTTGLLPDFAVGTRPDDYVPVVGRYIEKITDGQYNMNACRDPWRLSLDYILTGDTTLLQNMQKLNSFFINKTREDPRLIHDGYYLNGDEISSYFYNRMSFISPLGVSAMIDGSNQEWLNKIWDRLTLKPSPENDSRILNDVGYYNDSIQLLNMIIISGNYWAP